MWSTPAIWLNGTLFLSCLKTAGLLTQGKQFYLEWEEGFLCLLLIKGQLGVNSVVVVGSEKKLLFQLLCEPGQTMIS
jgi:hypothetical protein